VNVTAEQGLAVLFEALALTGAPGRIDEYRLSVTFVRSGSEAIVADCLVRVTATQASTPVVTPTAAGRLAHDCAVAHSPAGWPGRARGDADAGPN
jgi:hypothetical protein